MNDVICLSLKTMQQVEFPDTCVICLGNFDGVHLAHRVLMHTAKRLRAHRFRDAACGVFCFDPPTSDYLSPSPEHLCTREEKLKRFCEAGMEYAFLADFAALRSMSPAQFVKEILLEACHCVAAVCGFNFRFGYKGIGTPNDLQALLNAPVEIVDEVQKDGTRVCSSYIRELLHLGKAEQATELLTHPYTLCAKVVHGKELGRTWGFPTVNQSFPQKMLVPRHGVYVTDCELPNGEHYRGVSNVGVRPTVDRQAEVNCETHLLDFDGTLYEKNVTVSFLHFIRPEKKFDSAEDLRRQIEADIQAAREY